MLVNIGKLVKIVFAPLLPGLYQPSVSLCSLSWIDVILNGLCELMCIKKSLHLLFHHAIFLQPHPVTEFRTNADQHDGGRG